MPLEQADVIIGEDSILIESLPASDALKLLTKTIRIVGGMGKGIKDFPKSKAEFDALGKELEKHLHLGNMIEGLIDRLDSDELPKMVKGIIKDSLPGWRDKQSKFDGWYEERFSNDLPGLLLLLVEIYKFNYKELFSWFADFFSATQEKEPVDPEKKPEK